MKKLFAPIILFALSGMILTSCSNTSKLAFNKRHYRSGNFNDAVGKNRTLTPQVAKTTNVVSHPTPTIVKPENHITANTAVVVLSKSGVNQNIIQDKEPIGIATNSSKQELSQTLAVAENPIIQTSQNVTESVGSHGDSGGSGAALSLLWIVIVVILILWLIGILAGGFGLGGLINVLLIIALVLLILWLLRVW